MADAVGPALHLPDTLRSAGRGRDRRRDRSSGYGAALIRPKTPLGCATPLFAPLFAPSAAPSGVREGGSQSRTGPGFATAGYIATIGRMARRAETIELAVLGLLHEGPMHGYELRKRLNLMLGWGRVLSYGSLYPALKKMLRAALIEETPSTPDAGDPAARASSTQVTDGRAPRVRAADVGGRSHRLGGRQLRHPLRLLQPHRHGDPAARPRGTAHPAPGAARPGPDPAGHDPEGGRPLRRRAPAPRRRVGRARGAVALRPDQRRARHGRPAPVRDQAATAPGDRPDRPAHAGHRPTPASTTRQIR